MNNWVIFKYAITSAVVVAVSEFAKRNDKLGGLIGALPIVTILTLIWLFFENQSTEKIANHAYYTFWYVVPTLPAFLIFPMCLARLGFWLSLLSFSVIALITFVLFGLIMRKFGVDLLF